MVLTAKIGTLLKVLFRKPMAESVDLSGKQAATDLRCLLLYTLVREACVLAGSGYNSFVTGQICENVTGSVQS